MGADMIYRKMRSGEERRVFDLVKAGFDEYVLPDLTLEGAKEFFRAASEMIYERPAGHFILVAERDEAITGMIDVRDNNHICLFFVGKAYQCRGIGRGLLGRAVAECRAHDPGIFSIEVNSSLFAVQIYKKLGFRESAPEQFLNGIRFVPMIKMVKESKFHSRAAARMTPGFVSADE